ncbi:SEN1 N terminal-domain-containing protein [Lipomyces arxii]|uniref:SEN1 N terminal-domain-containing protein n=1 Tax=Lipomyces arxii TaxID=56418 RepID=UPI0034CFA679
MSSKSGHDSDKAAIDRQLTQVIAVIEESHKHPDDNGLQDLAIQESFAYLTKLPSTSHLFCNEQRRKVTITALQVFAFPQSPELTWLKSVAGKHLKECFLCVKAYQKAKFSMRKTLLEQAFDRDSIEEFMGILNKWDVDRVTTSLEPSAEKCRASLQTNSNKPIPGDSISECFNALYECLYAPNLLELSPQLATAFKSVFFGVQAGGRFLRLSKEVVPAMLSFLFLIHEPDLVRWAEKSMKMLTKKVVEADFDPCVRRAYHEDIIGRYMHSVATRKTKDVEAFWKAMGFIFRSFDRSVLIRHCCGGDQESMFTNSEDSIVKLLWADLQAFPASIHALLNAFAAELSVLDKDFWQLSQPFIPMSLPDLVLGQHGAIAFEGELRSSTAQGTAELLNWVRPFSLSISGSTRLSCCKVLVSHFLGRYQEPSKFGTARDDLRLRCTDAGFNVLKILLEYRSHDLFFNGKNVDRIMRREAREVSETYGSLIVQHSFSKNLVTELAREVLVLCLQTDCMSAVDESAAMTSETLAVAVQKQKEITAATISQAETDASAAERGSTPQMVSYGKNVWEALTSKLRADDVDIARVIVNAIGESRTHLAETADMISRTTDSLGGVSATSPSTKLIALTLKKYERSSNKINEVLNAAADLLRRISDFTASKIKTELLEFPEIVSNLLSLSMSAHAGLSRYSLEIVKQAYDASGRMECLQGLFRSNPAPFLAAYVSTLTHTGAISGDLGLGPVPKLVRLTMDVANLLFDSRTGYVALHNSSIPDGKVRTAAFSFWSAVWRSLSFIFRRTLNWARAYPKEIMVDYMRDVLELSSDMFSNLQLMEQALSENAAGEMEHISPTKNRNDNKLLLTLIEPLREMCPWLRLSDSALLQVCVRLVCGFLREMARTDIEVPHDIFKKLDKLSRQTDSHFSNLTDGQCYDLVIAVTAFDAAKLPEVIKSEKIKQEQPQTVAEIKPIKTVTSLDPWLSKAEKQESYDLESDEEANMVKALESTEMSRQTSVPQVKKARIEVSRGPKPSLLDARRQEIARKRLDAARAASANDVVHPPRPPGFRVKAVPAQSETTTPTTPATPATVTPSDDGSSDDQDSDSDVDSLFALSKHNRPVPKPVMAARLAPQPLRVPNSIMAARRNNFGPPAISEKERNERNMRARLRVNVDPLYQRILRWDYHSKDDLPSDEVGNDMSKYRAVPNKFSTAMEYKAVFEPLLMLECVQNIIRAKEEGQDKPFRLSVTNRVSCDDYIELYASIDSKVLNTLKLGDMDVIVLTYVPDDQEVQAGGKAAGKDRKPMMPDPKYVNCLAKIKEVKRSSEPDLHDVCLRCLPKPEMARNLLPRAELNALRVISMTTIEREYSSLMGLPYYDLLDSILKAKPAQAIRPDANSIRRTQRLYDVNAPQAGAILATMESTGFTLIQGPPGTGKTKTILGIVGATLTTAKSKGIPITMPGQKAPQRPASPAPVEHKRILVCAPSNAAVDEILLRLKNGIRNSAGEIFFPKIVRLGRSDIINPAVRDLTLEELIEAETVKLEQDANKKSGGEKSTLRDQLNKVLTERAEIDKKLNNTDDQDVREKLRSQREIVNAKKAALGQRLDDERDRHAVVKRTNEIERRNIQNRILTGAEIVCATLSGAGHDLLASLALTFETVIIDEAAQCVEISALIPLKYGCVRCAMVGDPNQLPPTVLSQTASKFNYEQSLFVRVQKNFPSAVHLLSIQYRMHPAISLFPSAQFYNSKLIDGDGMPEHTKAEWHSLSHVFGPYRFFNVNSREQQSKMHSYFNRAEALCALELYRKLTDSFPNMDFTGRVGIVTPYKQQLIELRNTFRSALGMSGVAGIDFNTVDGFQGQEKEIIILSCVRADGGQSKGVGFLADVRRMNVALTRAKSSLWIIGNMQSLVTNDVWRKLVEDAVRRGLVSEYDNGRITALRPTSTELMQEQAAVSREQNTARARAPLAGGPKQGEQVTQASGSRPVQTVPVRAQNTPREVVSSAPQVVPARSFENKVRKHSVRRGRLRLE